MANLDSVLKSSVLKTFADKGPYSQSYGFSSSHVQMWELDHKEGWAPKNWCFQTVLEKSLESPSDCREIKAVNPKGNQPWIFFRRTDAEAETLVLWPPDAKSQLMGGGRRTQILGKIEGKRRQEQQRMRWLDSITNSIGMSLSKFLETGEDRRGWPAVLQSIGSQSQTQLSDWTTKSRVSVLPGPLTGVILFLWGLAIVTSSQHARFWRDLPRPTLSPSLSCHPILFLYVSHRLLWLSFLFVQLYFIILHHPLRM